MDISKEPFGITPEGNHVDQFTLTNDHGLRAKIMTYGATIIAVKTPDRHGKSANITLALDSLDDYLKGHPYLGSTVGRYANRIARGRFKIGGVEYTLAVNNGPNHLHGGVKAFDKVGVESRADRERGIRRREVFATRAPTARKATPATFPSR